MNFPLPANDFERLAALHKYNILDTPPEPEFDDVAILAAQICRLSIAFISLVDERREWFKSQIGVSGITEIPRDLSLCAYAVCRSDLFVVPDARADARFAANPFVTGNPHVRFYASAPLVTPEGYTIGALCVVDTVPRQLSEAEGKSLSALARSVVAKLELRRKISQLDVALEEKQESEDHYRRLFDRNPHPIWVYETETLRFLAVNEKAVQHYGYTREEFFSMTIKDIRPSEDVPLMLEYVAEAAATQQSLLHLVRHQKKDGTIIDAEVVAQSIVYGGKTARLSLVTDVTERRRMEAELRDSEAELRALFGAMPDVVLVMDKNGRYLKVPPTNPDLLYKPAADVIGKNIYDIFPPDQAEWFLGFIRQALTSEEQVHLEYPLVIGGAEMWFSATVARLTEDSVIWVARDVSKRKRAEAELRSAHQRLQFHVENTPIGVVEWDKDLNILKWSPEAERIFGWAANEVSGRKIGTDFRFFYEEDAASVNETVARLLGGREKRNTFTNRSYRKDGSLVVCEWFNSALIDESGAVVSVMSLALDITERKRMETELRQARDAALEATRLKSAFLANISHEIRTPMNGVIGMTDLLLDTNITPKQREYTEIIKSSADALLVIINDVLDLSKIESGKLRFEDADFDLTQIVKESINLLAEKARAKNLKLSTSIAANVPAHLYGDAGRLRQVLVNLLGNAVKFTERGAVDLNVVILNENKTSVRLRFEIRDTGIGISDAATAELFQPFTQADASTTRRYGGTGLGLAISKQLIEMMGGEIKVESNADAGSTFWFTAELKKQSHAEPQNLFIKGDNSTASFDNLRVLLVEDNIVNTKVALGFISKFGCTATAVVNGLEAVAALERDFYDIILMDCQMPEMDGYEATREIRRREKTGSFPRHVPIIAMTANVMQGDREKCLAAGMDDYLPKPMRAAELRDTIIRWCFDRNAPRDEDVAVQNDSDVEDQSDAANNEPPVDVQTLAGFAALQEDEPNFVAELVNIFLIDNEVNLRKLKDSVKNGDFLQAADIAHKISGSSGTFGAHRTASLARKLRIQCLENDAAAAVSVQAINDEFSRVKDFLKANFR